LRWAVFDLKKSAFGGELGLIALMIEVDREPAINSRQMPSTMAVSSGKFASLMIVMAPMDRCKSWRQWGRVCHPMLSHGQRCR
jgi:hypothetical protein